MLPTKVSSAFSKHSVFSTIHIVMSEGNFQRSDFVMHFKNQSKAHQLLIFELQQSDPHFATEMLHLSLGESLKTCGVCHMKIEDTKRQMYLGAGTQLSLCISRNTDSILLSHCSL